MPPTPSTAPAESGLWVRSTFARTNANMLVNDGATGINPSEVPPIWWYGIDSGGGQVPIGPNGPWPHGQAEALPVVIRATSLITSPLSAAPFKVQELGFGGRPLARPRWVTDPCLLRADARYDADVASAVLKLPRGEWYAEWVRQAIWWGVSAFITELDDVGQPLAGTMRLVSSAMLSTERDTDGALHWVLGADGASREEQAVFNRDGFLALGPVSYKIVVLRNPHSPVDAEGYSKGVFAMSPGTFGMAQQIDAYQRGQLRSGIPNGVLKVNTPGLTQEQADQLKAAWVRSHGNDRRSIGVLNSTTEFVPFNLSPVDAALDAQKRLSIGDCAMAFGLDPLTLGVSLGNSATYTNLRDAWANHRDFGISAWITAVQDTLSALLPGSQGVVVDLDKFANPTLKERMDGYKVAIDAGVMTPDECRELEGLPPLGEPPAPEQPPAPPRLQSVEEPDEQVS